jgi:hypothetical protein
MYNDRISAHQELSAYQEKYQTYEVLEWTYLVMVDYYGW